MTDYQFLAHLNIDCERPKEALENILTLCSKSAKLTLEQRDLLNLAVKTSVDPTRSSVKKLNNIITTERSAGHSENVEELLKIKKNCVTEILDICNKTLDVIEHVLIPENSDDRVSLIHYQKVRGDLYRYIIEVNPDQENAFKNASDSYNYAYVNCQELLEPCIPIRLGTFLNYAVFKYEYLKCVEEATEMLQQALAHYTEGLDKQSQVVKEDVLNIVRVIRDNIQLWTVADSTDDSEPEEEEEEEEDHQDSPNHYDSEEEDD
ncbi:14-3-3 protein domain-containing protein [Trichomonas vaginalis G3]|uniref:14-3-3 protein domain-containing protein n=1 Tax=Trichomonas vaginalis (strain ATCC PRA-98 / G3) TaxID=412133 RepID=UPI0021E55E64|nr:14-3-3 protein domain-containing protein [Trichomonas vaginalis G3]KAI5529291.1 14-3-3 protein domain-containing protein [Trichomonas vaginalis G3]